MSNHYASKSLGVAVRTLASVCIAFALTVPAAAECRSKTYTLDVPDASTLKLKDGEHTIAAVATEQGKLEARVTVKGKIVSETKLFVGGKPLKEISETQIPESVSGCVQKAALSPESWIAKAFRTTLDWMVPTVYANQPCKLVVTATCGRALDGTWYCVYKVCCGRSCTWET